MDTILPHGGDASQGGYLRNVRGPETVRLIRQQDDLRVLLRYLAQLHARVALVAPLEDVGAAADGDEVVRVGARADGHPGVPPDGTEGAHRWPPFVGGADLRQRLPRPFDDPPGLRASARHRGQLLQQVNRPGHGRGQCHVDLEPLTDQRLDVLLAVLLGAGDDEVGLKGYYPGHVQRLGAADPRLLGDRIAGLDAEVGDAHDRVAHAEREQRLRQAGHQRDDAPRRRWQPDLPLQRVNVSRAGDHYSTLAQGDFGALLAAPAEELYLHTVARPVLR